MPNNQDWLQAEQDGQDSLAEMMFASLVAGTPSIEPGPDFVGRTVRAAWRARARRRFMMRFAGIAVVLLIAIATLGSMYEFGLWGAGLIVRGAVLSSHGLVWLLTWAGEEARWWWIAERIGTAVNDAIAAPSTTAAVAAVGLIALLVIYAFRQLLRDEQGTHESRKVRI